jgi:signal transduction histidine kinase
VHAAHGSLSVVIENGPPRDTATGLDETGGAHGITGLHARLAVIGGELRAEPTRDGGWRLTADMPTE